jgi:plastocyanin
MSLKQRAYVAMMVTAIAAASVACGPADKPQASTATSAPAAAASITIANFGFTSPPSVPPGATVAVNNADPMKHSVTADADKAFSVDVDGGETATFTAPSAPGTYDYHCAYHPMMHGQLIVK